MKFTLMFKTPDVEDQLCEDEREEAKSVIKKFVDWGEYIHIEFDTVAMTAVVDERN